MAIYTVDGGSGRLPSVGKDPGVYAINPNRPWTNYDVFLLRSLAPTNSTPEIARRLNRTIPATYTRASLLGISLMPPDPTMLNPYVWS
jgi:hypothetical protein